MERQTRKNLSIAAMVAAVFVVLAIGGSIFTSRQMNRTADEHAMSSGISGEGKPNGLQEFQNDKAARGSATIKLGRPFVDLPQVQSSGNP